MIVPGHFIGPELLVSWSLYPAGQIEISQPLLPFLLSLTVSALGGPWVIRKRSASGLISSLKVVSWYGHSLENKSFLASSSAFSRRQCDSRQWQLFSEQNLRDLTFHRLRRTTYLCKTSIYHQFLVNSLPRLYAGLIPLDWNRWGIGRNQDISLSIFPVFPLRLSGKLSDSHYPIISLIDRSVSFEQSNYRVKVQSNVAES